MSRQYKNDRKALQLPQTLQSELGLSNSLASGNVQEKRRHNAISARKAQRQVLRNSKKSNGTSLRREAVQSERSQHRTNGSHHQVLRKGHTARPEKIATSAPQPQVPRSILKNARVRDASPISDATESDQSLSQGFVLDASSKTYKERSAQDDAEIASLEKRLGLKKKKAKRVGDDMLDYLLEGLDDTDEESEHRQDSQLWLSNKRRKLVQTADMDEDKLITDSDQGSLTDDSGSSDDEVDLEGDVLDVPASSDEEATKIVSNDDHSQSDTFSGFESDSELATQDKPIEKKRENPYIAPVTPGIATAKYIPPSLRDRDANEQQTIARLKKQVQGCLNKLSEANLVSILNEIEDLYRTNARQDVTTTIVDLLLTTFCNPSALQNTFIILHAAFVVAVFKVMGPDFGAEMLVRLVERVDDQYRDLQNGKQTLNLVSLLANLFTFGMIGSNIVYDYVRLMLSDFNESNAELLLRIVRDCGPQLRSDDPSALKGIVQLVQKISSDMTRNGQQLNVRTKVMIDTIIDLKNNRMKNATNAAGVTGEHITRMRKTLGSLNARTLKATEPLRITKQDIESSDKKGKWWLVGASWKGDDKLLDIERMAVEESVDDLIGSSEQEPDFLALAKQFRMNTDVRRSIFVAIMSAEDVKDAQLRLLKLRLTSKQEQEIAKVLLRCIRAEPVYNPYYALLAKNLCKENKRVRMSLQFSLWGFFNALGETDDEDEDVYADEEDHNIEINEIVNIAKMFAFLVFQNHLTLGILKTLNIGFLKEQANTFLEIFIITILTQPAANKENLLKVFGRAADTPQIVKSLQYFITKFVRKSDLVSKVNKKMVKEGCRIAEVALTMISSADMILD